MKKIALLTALTALSFANAEEGTVKEQNPHNVYFGPVGLWQHLSDVETEKTSEGVEVEETFKSNGYFGGGRLGYEHLKKDSIYFGIDGTFAAGRVKDKIEAKATVKDVAAELTIGPSHDRTALFGNAESRIGYTFGGNSFTLSPFVGSGWSYQKFDTKSDIWADWFYGTAGFKSNFDVTDIFGIGLNAKAVYNFAANAHTPVGKAIMDGVDRTWGYELGLPLTWHLGESKNWDIQMEPYFSQLSTKLGDKQAGARLMATYKF